MAQPPNPRANLVRQRIDRWNQFHPQHAIDPQAALAVASREGLSGRIGDGGHAFGDFQLNDAGGVLTGKFPGQSAQQKQAWASSPAGIDYALAGIAKAAGGQKGQQAVRSIVTNFERPANIPGEIAGALGALGQFAGGGQVPSLGGAGAGVPSSAAPAAAAPQLNQPNLQALLKALTLSSSNQWTTPGGTSGDYSGFYQQLGQSLKQQAQPSPVAGALGRDPQATTIPQQGANASEVPTVANLGKWVKLSPTADRKGVTIHHKVLNFVDQVAQVYGKPLEIGTGTNHNQYVVNSHRQSDHWEGNAADIPASGAALTRLGQAALIAAGMPAAEARKQKGGVYNVGGHQILFNTKVGGNHFNHLHVSAK